MTSTFSTRKILSVASMLTVTVCSYSLSKESWQETTQSMKFRINGEIYTPYAVGMLLHTYRHLQSHTNSRSETEWFWGRLAFPFPIKSTEVKSFEKRVTLLLTYQMECKLSVWHENRNIATQEREIGVITFVTQRQYRNTRRIYRCHRYS